jgi:hypothetical protein
MTTLLTFVALMTIKPISAYSGANMYTDPPAVMRKDLQVGDKFTIDIRLENVSNILVIGFDMSWSTYYLNLTGITYQQTLPGPIGTWSMLIGWWDSAAGYVEDVTCGTLGTSWDVTNNTVVTAEFEIMHPGSSIIDIYDCEAIDSGLNYVMDEDSPYDCAAHLSEVLIHSAIWDSVTYYVATESNSTVTNFNFSQPGYRVYFNATGEDGTTGYTNVTIPKNLLDVDPGQPPYDWIVAVDFVNMTSAPTSTDNGTHSFVYFTYTHSEHRIDVIGNWVVPEFSALIMALIILVATIIALVSVRKVYILDHKPRYS